MSFVDAGLVDKVYAAGLLPELWPSVIDGLSERLGARGGSLFLLSEGQLAWTAPTPTRQVMEQYIAEGWDRNNTRLERLIAAAHPGFVQDSDLFLPGEYGELPIVRDFLVPQDIAFTAATAIRGPKGDLAVFSVDRRHAQGAFTQEDFFWLNGLRPHLARSVALASRLKLRQAATAVATLQMVGIPAAVLSGRRTVSATNTLFDALAGRVFLPAGFGLLALADRRADKLLGAALAEIDASRGGVRSIPVLTADGSVGGVLHVVPARLQTNDILGAGGTLLVLAQPRSDVSVASEWLQWLYDLSPAEGKIGTQLAEGRSIDEIARRSGNSVQTIRTQVKSLLRKTGFRRQIDFVRSIGSLHALEPLVPLHDRTQRAGRCGLA